MDVFESEHAAAIAEMNKQIKAIGDKTIGDYKKYEKVCFCLMIRFCMS